VSVGILQETRIVHPRARRFRTHPCDWGIRRVKGQRFQLRIYLGRPTKADSWNFGLYETHEAARYARRKLTAIWRPGMGPLAALRAAKAAGVIPPGVLPRWVRRVPGGYAARRVTRTGTIELPGPFPDPETAYRAMAAAVAGRHHT
jgi:hypothetical protein